jgi:hypothetical protein
VLKNFLPEKSDGFGRVWTRELGYQRPARYLWTTEPANVMIISCTFSMKTKLAEKY